MIIGPIHIDVLLIDLFLWVRKVLFSTIIRSRFCIGRGWRIETGVSIHLTRIMSTPLCQEKCREDSLERYLWFPIGVTECLERCVLELFIWVIDSLGLYVTTIWNNRKGFSSGNDMWGNVVTIIQKGLDWYHNLISDIFEVCVVFNLLCEYVARIYDTWYMLHVNILWLMTFANHILSEV